MSDIELANTMRELANGEVGAKEAKSLIAALVAKSADHAARKAYPALQEVAWRLVRSRSAPEDLDEWISVYRFCERLLDKHARPDVARHIEALGDMVARTARYADLQPAESTLNRRHVVPLLEQLKQAGGQLRRKDLKRYLSLEEANLSRLIVLLEAGGLVVRKTAGREAMIELTSEGHRSLPEPQPAQDIFVAVGAQLKDAADIAVSVCDADVHLVANSCFEKLVGLPASAATELAPGSSKTPWFDLQTAENRWIRCLRLPTMGGKSTSFWVDVSDLKSAADRAQQHMVRLEAELAHVRADKEAILARQADHRAFQNAVGRRMGALLSEVKKSAALTHTVQSLVSHHGGFLEDLAEIQSVVLDDPPFGSAHSLPTSVDAMDVFQEVVKIASVFSEDTLKTSKPTGLPEIQIVPEPVLDTFRNCAVRGIRFREVKMSRHDGMVVFHAVTGARPPLDWHDPIMPSTHGDGSPSMTVHTAGEQSEVVFEVVAPIYGGFVRGN